MDRKPNPTATWFLKGLCFDNLKESTADPLVYPPFIVKSVMCDFELQPGCMSGICACTCAALPKGPKGLPLSSYGIPVTARPIGKVSKGGKHS
jgi:hypothetical protein